MRNIRHHPHVKAKQSERDWRNLLEIAARLSGLIVPRSANLSMKLKLIPLTFAHGSAVTAARRRAGRQE